MPQVTDLDNNAGPKIIDLANVGHLKVPQYQRAFTWNKAITTRLLEDLIRHKISFSAHAATEPYYLGNLLIHVDGNNNNVVDGQQRLCALTIICAAIRDACIKTGTMKKAYEIHSKIIKDQHYNNALTAWHDGTDNSFRNQLQWIQNITKPRKAQRKFKSRQNATVSGAVQPINIRGNAKSPVWKMEGGIVEFENTGTLQLTMGNITPTARINGVDVTFTSLNGVLSNHNVIDQELGTLTQHPDFRGDPPHGIDIREWKKGVMIKRYFECDLILTSKLRGKNITAKRQYMEELADIVLNIQFTVSKFTDLAQAIQYFGTFNSSENKIPLSVGDLMRQWVAYVVLQQPVRHTADIQASWSAIDRDLNINCSVGDQLEDFFVSYLIATKRRYTKSSSFSGLEREYIGRDINLPLGRATLAVPAGVPYSQQLLYQHPNWEKLYIKNIMEDFEIAAGIYREICDPLDSPVATLAVGGGDQHAARLKAIWRSGITQFRGLLLAGMIKFRSEERKTNLSRADRIRCESYLIGIIEYIIVRGYIIPSSVDRGLLPVAPAATLGKSLDSKIAYGKVEEWSEWLRNHGKLGHYGDAAEPADEDAAALLDRIKTKVLEITNPFDCLFEVGGAAAPPLLSLKLKPYHAQLILIRLELERRGWATAPLADYQVEHIYPNSPERGEWVAFAPAGLAETNLNKLGNLTLLPSAWNQYVGNSEYANKQTDIAGGPAGKDYTRAAAGLNIKLCDEISTTVGVGIYADWTPAEVALRSSLLGNELFDTFCNASLDSGNF